jgi:hypothetical protein
MTILPHGPSIGNLFPWPSLTVQPMMMMFTRSETVPAPPSNAGVEIDGEGPLLNHRGPLLAFMISFMVRLLWSSWHARAHTKLIPQAFSWICSLLRLYARVALRAPGFDDIFIVLTMVLLNLHRNRT